MKNEKRTVFVLPVKGELISVSKEVYIEFYKSKNHEEYLKYKDKINGLVSYDSWEMSSRVGVDFLIDENTNIEDEVMKRVHIKELMKCIKLLNKDEMNLLYKIYYEDKTEKEIASILKVTQQAVNVKKKSLLKKLYIMLKGI